MTTMDRTDIDTVRQLTEDMALKAGILSGPDVAVVARRDTLEKSLVDLAVQYRDYDHMVETLANEDARKRERRRSKIMDKARAISPGGLLEPLLDILENHSARTQLFNEVGRAYRNAGKEQKYNERIRQLKSISQGAAWAGDMKDQEHPVDSILFHLFHGHNEEEKALIDGALIDAQIGMNRTKMGNMPHLGVLLDKEDLQDAYSRSMKISSIAAVMGIEFDGTHAMRKETRQSLQNQAVKSLEAQADRPYEPFNIGFEKSDLVQLHMAKTFPSDFEQTPKLRHDMLVAYSKYREILSAPEIDQPQPIAADRVGAAWTGHVSIHRRAEDLGRSTGVLDVPESALIGRKILLGRLWDEAGQPLENEDNLQTVLENLQSKQRSMKEERQQRLEYLEMAIAETGPGGSIQALMDVLSDARATRELGIEVARILRADSDITPDKLKDRVEAGSIVHNLLAAAPQEKKQWVASSIINGFLGATGSFFGGRLDDKKSALFGARWARKIISPDNTPHGAISVNGVVQKARSEIKSIQHALDDDVGIPCQEDRFLAAIKTIFPEAVVDERITRNVRFFLHEIDALRREQETIKVDESPLQESAEQPQAVASRTSWFGGLLRSKREREGSNLPPRPPSLDC